MFVGFIFEKCMEAVGVLFGTTESHTMSRMRLLKLLYMANRRSLTQTGKPIVDDDVYAMKFGPVLSQTYDLIKSPERPIEIQTIWRAHFKVVDRIQLEMVKDPGTDHLSDYDVETLTAIAHQYQDMDDDDLSQLTHGFEEYIRNWGSDPRPAVPISERDILMGIGFTPEEIEENLSEAGMYARERKLLGCR